MMKLMDKNKVFERREKIVFARERCQINYKYIQVYLSRKLVNKYKYGNTKRKMPQRTGKKIFFSPPK